MRIKLLRDSRIIHKAGEVVDASPAECSFLTSVGSAVYVVEKVAVKMPEAQETKTEKTTKRVIRK